MRIKDIMSHPVVTASLGASMDVVARRMWEHNCGAIVIVDEDDRLAGLITDRDICMAAYTQGKPLHAIAVTSAMAREVSTCREEDSLHEAEKVMCSRRVRRVPVVNAHGVPVGMVTMDDLARNVTGTKGGRKTAQETAVLHTLAAVCGPPSDRGVESEEHRRKAGGG
ncbi:MAG TPA: CBS domain-containing protein [Candidatus Eisenbacteria bacterium]